MDFDTLIKNEELKKILDHYQESENKRSEYELGFNVFSLISDTYYKENFHSEIVSEILSPNNESKPANKHKEGRIFLDAFLDYIGVDKDNYQNNVQVINEHPTDERRRIDILIQSDTHAVIIENKINDAINQPNQLLDYYRYCVENKKEVDAIIYLTKDGKSSPPYNSWGCTEEEKKDIKEKVKPMGAFDLEESSLTLHQWLKACIDTSTNEDNKLILKQYSQLLKSIRRYIMESKVLKEYYDFVAKNSNPLLDLVQMYKALIYYFPEKLKEKIDSKYNRYYTKSDIYLKDNRAENLTFYNIGNSECKLKIEFFECEENAKDFSVNIQLYVYDEDKQSLHNDKLQQKQKFNTEFIKDGEGWKYKKHEKYQLLTNFDELVNDVADILKFISGVIQS